jgi:DNA-binding NarL/FixJ family response regulator
VVGQYSDLDHLLALSSPLRPDIVLIDAALPHGPAAVAQARRVAPDARIIVFAVRETENDIIEWAQAGVIGYLPRTAARADLARLIMDIHNEQVCPGKVAAGLLRHIADVATILSERRGMASPDSILTRREQQIADPSARGSPTKKSRAS